MSKYNFCVEDISLEAVINKLGGVEGAKRFLRGELELKEVVKISTALSWQEATAKAYDLLGMKVEYEETSNQFNLTEDPNRWKLVVIKGLIYNKLVKAIREAGSGFWSYYDDLDSNLDSDKEVRCPNRDGSYAISLKAVVEADKENKNQSANQRQEQGCKDITLLERLLLELIYFLATGKHLDVKNITLCTGSRNRYGRALGVRWDSGDRRVDVYWYYPGSRYVYLRARSVSVLPAEASEARRNTAPGEAKPQQA
jgi:hypothetical protein